MNLMGMSFKNFVWRNNPTKLDVTAEKNLKETVLPFTGSTVESLGERKRHVTGEGYFVGEDCWEQWNALKAVYTGGAGSLMLPGQSPFPAVMDSLKLIGVSGKSLVKYSFSFTEADSEEENVGLKTCIAREGESLWDYACKYNLTIDAVTAANPNIRDILHLAAGEEVRIP